MADEQRPAAVIDAALDQRKRLLNPQASAPEHDDHRPHPIAALVAAWQPACPDCCLPQVTDARWAPQHVTRRFKKEVDERWRCLKRYLDDT